MRHASSKPFFIQGWPGAGTRVQQQMWGEVPRELLRASVLLNLLLALYFSAPRSSPEDDLDGRPAAPAHQQRTESAFSLEDKPWASNQEWTAFPLNGVCGNWAAEYTRFHKAAREAQGVNVKFITYNPEDIGGLGDRLNGLVATFLAALISRRVFFIHPSALIEGGFDPAEIDWHAPSYVPMHITTNITYEGQVVLNGTAHLRVMNHGNKGPDVVRFNPNLVETFQAFAKADNVVVQTNSGILSAILGSKAPSRTRVAIRRMGIRMPYAFGCIVRYLLRPKPEVWTPVQKPLVVMQQPRVTSMCAHMRTTDNFAFKGHTEEMRNFVKKAKEVVECAKVIASAMAPASHDFKVLFLSDSKELLPPLQEAYPGLVIDSGIKAGHVALDNSSTVLQSALADWLLFSRCQYYVIGESGFPKTSSAYNLLPPFRFLFSGRFDAQVGLNFTSCQDLEPVPLISFHGWSGL